MARRGALLRRVGKMAEPSDDHSLLQLGVSGQLDGQEFRLVGRLQYRSATGAWSEWHALLSDGSTGWLAEDNGAYVFSRAITVRDALPAAGSLSIGATTTLDGQHYAVTASLSATLAAAEGELPHLPALGDPFAVIQTTSPLIARQSFWTVVQTVEAAGLTATPYHAHVPSFGEWGFVIASRRPWRQPTALPTGLRFLTLQTLPLLFDFPLDMARVPAEVNRLSNQVLVHTYEREWGRVHE